MTLELKDYAWKNIAGTITVTPKETECYMAVMRIVKAVGKVCKWEGGYESSFSNDGTISFYHITVEQNDQILEALTEEFGDEFDERFEYNYDYDFQEEVRWIKYYDNNGRARVAEVDTTGAPIWFAWFQYCVEHNIIEEVML